MSAPVVTAVPVRRYGYTEIGWFCGTPEGNTSRVQVAPIVPTLIHFPAPGVAEVTFADDARGQSVDLLALKAWLETANIVPGVASFFRSPDGHTWSPAPTNNGNLMLRRDDFQMAAVSVTNADREKDRVPDTPRMRRTIAAATSLTTTWQQLRFRNLSVWDQDTFDTAGAGPRYNMMTDRLIAGTTAGERQYQFEFHWDIAQVSPLATLNPTRLQLRLHVPRPAANGGPVYFPFPTKGVDGAIDLDVINHNEPRSDIFTQRLYFNEVVRSYGIQIEARTTAASPLGLRSLRLTEHTAIALYPC